MLAEDKIPRSEKKDFIIYGIPSSMKFLLSVLLKSHAGEKGLKWMLHIPQVYIIAEKPQAR